MTEEEDECSPIDMAALLNEHAPRDKVKAIVLRKAVSDLLHGSQGARKCALETLVRLGPDAGPLLVACAREDSPEVVEIALEGLGQLGWHCLVTSISAVLDSSRTELRIIALRAAGRLPDERRRPLLERGLRDPVARVRRRAISYVSWHESSWVISELMRLCDDEQPDVKWAAVEALMALRPSEARDHLQLMMPSLDPTYRRRAVALLARQEKSAKKTATAPTPKPPAAQPPKPVTDRAPETPAPQTPNKPPQQEPSEPKASKQAAGAGRKKKDTPERVDSPAAPARKKRKRSAPKKRSVAKTIARQADLAEKPPTNRSSNSLPGRKSPRKRPRRLPRYRTPMNAWTPILPKEENQTGRNLENEAAMQ